jgi:DNA-binding MarR family transcriptional regulator
MARRSTARRASLLEELHLEARRSGSLSSLHGRAAAALAGLNPTDWECLDVLDWVGPITAGDLARRVGITSGAVTGVVDRLTALGLVTREADPADRRRVIVRLAADGALRSRRQNRRLLEAFAALGADVDEVNDQFDDDELAAVVAWLGDTNAALERSIERMRSRPAS